MHDAVLAAAIYQNNSREAHRRHLAHYAKRLYAGHGPVGRLWRAAEQQAGAVRQQRDAGIRDDHSDSEDSLFLNVRAARWMHWQPCGPLGIFVVYKMNSLKCKRGLEDFKYQILN